MAEYIEREATCRDCFHYDVCDYHITELTPMTVNECSHKFVNKADVVEVRHGEWLRTEEPMGWHDVDCIECSACHESWVMADDVSFEDYVEGWKYCPNCGAKMDGKDE